MIPTGASPFATSAALATPMEARVLTEGAARLDPPEFEVAVETLFPPAWSVLACRTQNLNSTSPGAGSVSLSRPRMPKKVPSIGVGWLNVL